MSVNHLVSKFNRISEETRNCIQRREKEIGEERTVVKKKKKKMWRKRRNVVRKRGNGEGRRKNKTGKVRVT